MRRRLTRGTKRGFTLIELLVVVAIIALLISILLPSLAAAREQGRRAKCAANLRSILQASRLYLDDCGRFIHPQLFPEQLGQNTMAYDGEPINRMRGEGIITDDQASTLWDCPNALKKRLDWNGTYYWNKRYAFISYGANDWGLGEPDTLAECKERMTGLLEYLAEVPSPDPYASVKFWGIRENLVVDPARYICFGDSNRDGEWDQVFAQDWADWCRPWENPGAIHPRAGAFGANVGFFDSHVQWYPTWKNYEKQIPDGIMLSDYRPAGQQVPLENYTWRMMWSRDNQPHPEKQNH